MIPASVTQTQLKLVQAALGISSDELLRSVHMRFEPRPHSRGERFLITVEAYRRDDDGELLVVDGDVLTATYDIGVEPS